MYDMICLFFRVRVRGKRINPAMCFFLFFYHVARGCPSGTISSAFTLVPFQSQ